MKVPTYLRKNIKNYKEDTDKSTMIMSASDGNDLLEIWYFGELAESETEKYIIPCYGEDEIFPSLVVAKNPKTGEEIVIFDMAKHGYNSLFCDTYQKDVVLNRPLTRYDIPPSQLILELYYNIDYEDEKEGYKFDVNGNVILIDGDTVGWEDILCNGFDGISLSYVNSEGESICILTEELA